MFQNISFQIDKQAVGAMLLASIELDIPLPMTPIPWFEVFLGKRADQIQDAVDVSNSILGIRRNSSNKHDGTDPSSSGADLNDYVAEWDVATKGFIKSLSQSKQSSNNNCNITDDDEGDAGPAFLDPNSFLWDHQSSLFVAEINKTGMSSK